MHNATLCLKTEQKQVYEQLLYVDKIEHCYANTKNNSKYKDNCYIVGYAYVESIINVL